MLTLWLRNVIKVALPPTAPMVRRGFRTAKVTRTLKPFLATPMANPDMRSRALRAPGVVL